METIAQIDLLGISPLCDFPFTILSSSDVQSKKDGRSAVLYHCVPHAAGAST